MKFGTLIVCASVSALAFTSAHANNIQPISASVSTLVSDGEGVDLNSGALNNGTYSGDALFPDGNLHANSSWPPNGVFSSVVSGVSNAWVYPNTSTLALTASLSQVNNPYSLGLGYSDASANLSYYLEVVPKTFSNPVTTFTVSMSGAFGLNSNAQSTNTGLISASATLSVLPPIAPIDGTATPIYQNTFTQSDNYKVNLSLVPNEQYLVSMSAMISVEQVTATENVWLDPYFQIVDPTIASQYELIFSPGIGNFQSTPLPAALPLFASGLGAMGLLGWRRKRKARVVAA